MSKIMELEEMLLLKEQYLEELEAKNVELEEKLEDEIALSKEIEQNYLEAKEKLEIAVKALEHFVKDADDDELDTSDTLEHHAMIIRQALAAINAEAK